MNENNEPLIQVTIILVLSRKTVKTKKHHCSPKFEDKGELFNRQTEVLDVLKPCTQKSVKERTLSNLNTNR